MGKSRENKTSRYFIFVLAIQPGALFSFSSFPKQCTFRSDTKDTKEREIELHQTNFYLWQKYWTRWIAHLPRAQLSVHRRTTKHKHGTCWFFYLFLFSFQQEPRATKRWGNHPQADSVFGFPHYLSVNISDALNSNTNNHRNRSLRLQNFTRDVSKPAGQFLKEHWEGCDTGWVRAGSWKTSTANDEKHRPGQRRCPGGRGDLGAGRSCLRSSLGTIWKHKQRSPGDDCSCWFSSCCFNTLIGKIYFMAWRDEWPFKKRFPKKIPTKSMWRRPPLIQGQENQRVPTEHSARGQTPF